MPAGGTWKVQNKQRPGAYINFVSVPRPLGTIGTRGVIAVALPMKWGAVGEVIEVLGTDLLNGKSLAKIGYSAFDTVESLPFRLALSNCYKGLFYRIDTGATKATGTISESKITVAAKYPGTVGNQVSVAITETPVDSDIFTVSIYYKGTLTENFVVEEVEDLEAIESEWLDFIVTEEADIIPEIAGVTLQSGTDGETSFENLIGFFNAVEYEDWHCMAVLGSDTEANVIIKAKIEQLREQRGKKVQAALYNYNNANYEGIISCYQGYKTSIDTVTAELFPLFVASITAGAAVNESNTCRVLTDAIEIIDPVAEEDIDDKLKDGWFILTYMQDKTICVEQDINTLTEFTLDKNYEWCKNRVIRTTDEIGNSCALIFNKRYAGKVNNDSSGRNQFKAEIINLLETLRDLGAVTNVDGATDVTVLQGEAIDSVYTEVYVQVVDSMEKLYMIVYLRSNQ